jgi:RES domain-containing protein
LNVRTLSPATFYRFHTPRWAKSPLSGEGAARRGGRFNRPGLAALYLSTDVATAQLEYQQDESLMPPGTLVSYRVELKQIVDFSAGFDPAVWDSSWADWDCDWRAVVLGGVGVPPSWELGDQALAAGASGILFPSLRNSKPEALNLVVYVRDLGSVDSVTFHDPKGELGAVP